MPTYEYECRTCNRIFELQQSITAPPEAVCPECQGQMQRLVSGGVGFILKGSPTGHSPRPEGGCPHEQHGHTCCGREERCDRPPCDNDR